MSKSQPRPLLRWLASGCILALVLLALFLAGSNLFLSSKAGENLLQKNLERRTHGISWHASGANWSPWNGITVKELSARVKVPKGTSAPPLDPLIELREINLKPYWGQLLRGKKLFREVNLKEPILNIPMEYLLVAPPPNPAPVLKAEPKIAPVPQLPEATEPTITPPENNNQKPPPQPKASKKPVEVQPAPDLDQKRFWLRCQNARIRFYSLKLNKSFEVTGLDANLPLAGPPTTGSLSWKAVSLANQEVASAAKLPIEWKDHTWRLPLQDLTLNLPQFFDPSQAPLPFQVKLGGQLSPQRNRQSFRFQASLPSQPLPLYLVHKNTQFHCQSREVAGNFSGQGSLLNPNSWRFKGAMAMNEIKVLSKVRGKHLLFDTFRANFNYQNNTLLAPNLALRSEQLSLMGNGQLNIGGYLLAVLRFVAEPELSAKLTNIAVGSHLTRGWTRSWLQPLETPDRLYRDLHFEGILPNPMVNTGRKGEFIPLPDIVALLRAFSKQEVSEETPTPSTPTPTNP